MTDRQTDRVQLVQLYIATLLTSCSTVVVKIMQSYSKQLIYILMETVFL